MQHANLTLLLEAQQAAHAADPMPDAATRKDRLSRLEAALLAWEPRLVDAVIADFGHRSRQETRTAEVSVTLASLRHTRRRLGRWMKPRRQPTPLHHMPARMEVRPVPKGVVGILSPWNFPVLLSLTPLIDALGAGNRVMLKPSELTPRSAAVLADMLTETFSEEEVTTVQGGPEIAAAFSQLPFDHLLFTGSTKTGKLVAKAAAENLTPVTLELGGKSPAILGDHGDIDRMAERVYFGKFINAGQACVSPDYALVPEARVTEFADKLSALIEEDLPDWTTNKGYGALLADRFVDRMDDLVQDARNRGATVIQSTPAIGEAGRYAPTLIIAPPPECRVMQEEVFGPVLPIVGYKDRADAEAIVARNPDPLALYIFSENRAEQDRWLTRVPSGAAGVNECVIQLIVDTLPFGGVGASGHGAYHGRWGFDELSHLKGVLRQRRLSPIRIFTPPYSRMSRLMVKLVRRIT